MLSRVVAAMMESPAGSVNDGGVARFGADARRTDVGMEFIVTFQLISSCC